jgi:hypothetical protein
MEPSLPSTTGEPSPDLLPVSDHSPFDIRTSSFFCSDMICKKTIAIQYSKQGAGSLPAVAVISDNEEQRYAK